MMLRVWGYSMRQYFYVLVDSGLTLKYKTYAITTEDNLEEWENNTYVKKFGISEEKRENEGRSS